MTKLSVSVLCIFLLMQWLCWAMFYQTRSCLLTECIDFCLYLIFPVFPSVDFLRNLFSSALGLGSAEKVLDELTLDGVARYINSGKCESLPASTLPLHRSGSIYLLRACFHNAVIIDWAASFSAFMQVKTSSAWLEQEYPHVSISAFISQNKHLNCLKIISFINNDYYNNHYYC